MDSSQLAKVFSFSELPKYFDQVEKRMIYLVSEANPLIKVPMLRLITGLNKRFAMFFVIPVVKSQGKVIDESVINSCAALELLSIAFCIHDDVTDESIKRYGIPNINAVEGVNQAILIGDYILNLATQEALAVSKEIAEVVINSIDENRESEIIEIAERHDLDRTVNAYMNCIKLKTASHFLACCKVGALCAGLAKEKVNAFAKFGAAFGMTHQLLDDLLDFVSTEEIMGKPVGKDVEEGVYTLPLLLGLSSPDGNRIRKIVKELPKGSNIPPELLQLLISSGAIEKTIQEIRDYTEQAASALKGFNDDKILSGLIRFPSLYLDLLLEHSAVKLH